MQGAYKILNQELPLLENAVKEDSVREIVSCLLSQTEEVRRRELQKALSMMGELDERRIKIISDLTSILLKQTFLPVVENLRQAAANENPKLIEAATKLFDIK